MLHYLLALLACAALSVPAVATAQAFPTKPLRIVVPYPPGGFTDVVSRRVAQRLSTALGQPVLVENRPGAGTNLGAESVARAEADGHTLFMGTSSLAINRTLYPKLAYDAVRDFAPVGVFATTGYVLVAHPQLPAGDVAGLIALARAQPGRLNFGSSGNGAVNHLAGVMFNAMAGTEMQHVPYKGSQAALTDLGGGQIQLYWSSVLEALPLLSAGKVKAIGVTTPQRVGSLPQVPPIAATVPGYDVQFWMGLFAPAGTPAAAVARLGAELRRVAEDPEFRQELEQRGAAARFDDAAGAASLLAADIARWGDAVRRSGATVD